MQNLRDTLYLLLSYSLRMGFEIKADIYSKKAYALFPEDRRFLEARAYCLLMLGRFQEAEDLTATGQGSSLNLAYVRMRTALVLGLDDATRSDRIRVYLRARSEHQAA